MADEETTELGCGEYRIMVQDRCGTQFFCELKDIFSFSFNRILNEISEAQFKVSMKGTCCQCLGEINPWQHEIAIFRNDTVVWVGPIIDIEFDMASEVATINCRDLLTWADHRLVELADTDYEPEGTDLADAYVWLLNHAYCKDPWCMTWSVDAVGTPIELYYPAYDRAGGERWGGQYPVCGTEMRTLSDAGVDFTVVGRHLWGGAVARVNPVASDLVLVDSHFRNAPNVRVAGSKMATRLVSAGGDGGYGGYQNDQIWITPSSPYGPIIPNLLQGKQIKYGLLETFSPIQLYDEVDTTVVPNALKNDADSKFDLLSDPFVFITGGVLANSAPLTFEETLIPGGLIGVAIATTCRKLTQYQMRIMEISVSYDAESGEDVTLSLSPIGTP